MTEDKEGYRGQKDKNICEEGVEKGGSEKVGTSQTNIWHWKEARSSSSGLKHPQVLDKQQKGVITTINTTVPVSETSVPSPEKGDEKEKRSFYFSCWFFQDENGKKVTVPPCWKQQEQPQDQVELQPILSPQVARLDPNIPTHHLVRTQGEVEVMPCSSDAAQDSQTGAKQLLNSWEAPWTQICCRTILKILFNLKNPTHSSQQEQQCYRWCSPASHHQEPTSSCTATTRQGRGAEMFDYAKGK